jgi:hypothetical protein
MNWIPDKDADVVAAMDAAQELKEQYRCEADRLQRLPKSERSDGLDLEIKGIADRLLATEQRLLHMELGGNWKHWVHGIRDDRRTIEVGDGLGSKQARALAESCLTRMTRLGREVFVVAFNNTENSDGLSLTRAGYRLPMMDWLAPQPSLQCVRSLYHVTTLKKSTQ